MNLLRKLSPALLMFLVALCVHGKAQAACGSLPYVFTNNTSIVDASTTNANNAFLLQCATTVDNTQIGPLGIYASQMIPASVGQAIFGGSFGYTFRPNLPAQVPLTLQLAASQSADALDVKNSGASVVASIGATGVIAGLQFNGSGAGLTTGTIPDAALVTAPVTSVGAGTGIGSTGGTSPTISNTGIVSLSAGTGIASITGTNPATVGIAAGGVGQTQVANGYMDLTTAQTVGGAKTFTSTVTVPTINGTNINISGAASGSTQTIKGNNPSFYGVVISNDNATNGYPARFDSGGTAGVAIISPTGQYLTGSSTYGPTSATVNGNVTAANFYNGSRREWKKNIKPLNFDPLWVLKATDFEQYDCSDIRCGPVGTHKIGFIANDTPTILSGEKHDHFDAAALATVNSAAILQLSKKIDKLTFVLHALCLQPQNRGVAECAALSQ